MIVKLAQITRNAIVDVIAGLIDNSRGNGRIELLTSDKRVLAKLGFSKPCAPDGANGTLRFYDIKEDPAASGQGKAAWARILDGDGREIFACDVSDKAGNGTIRLNTDQIVPGGPVRISEFILTMPDQ